VKSTVRRSNEKGENFSAKRANERDRKPFAKEGPSHINQGVAERGKKKGTRDSGVEKDCVKGTKRRVHLVKRGGSLPI